MAYLCNQIRSLGGSCQPHSCCVTAGKLCFIWQTVCKSVHAKIQMFSLLLVTVIICLFLSARAMTSLSRMCGRHEAQIRLLVPVTRPLIGKEINRNLLRLLPTKKDRQHTCTGRTWFNKFYFYGKGHSPLTSNYGSRRKTPNINNYWIIVYRESHFGSACPVVAFCIHTVTYVHKVFIALPFLTTTLPLILF